MEEKYGFEVVCVQGTRTNVFPLWCRDEYEAVAFFLHNLWRKGKGIAGIEAQILVRREGRTVEVTSMPPLDLPPRRPGVFEPLRPFVIAAMLLGEKEGSGIFAKETVLHFGDMRVAKYFSIWMLRMFLENQGSLDDFSRGVCRVTDLNRQETIVIEEGLYPKEAIAS